MKNKLYKTEDDKKLCGVCGGIAEYFDVDSTLIRLAWIIFAVFMGSVILAYILAAIVMPNKSDVIKIKNTKKKD